MKKIVLFLIAALVLYLLFTLLSPLILFQIEDEVVKMDLNNPYVNDDFRGWHEAEIPGYGPIMLPERWTLVSEGYRYAIVDAQGAEIAVGAAFGYEESPFATITDFISSVLNQPVESLKLLSSLKHVPIDASDFGILTTTEDGQEGPCYLTLWDTTSQRTWMVFSDQYTLEDLQEIVQAIAYSQYLFY